MSRLHSSRTRHTELPTIEAMKVGKNLRRLRAQRFMTREELAEITGLHRDHIGRIERNEVEPRIPTIRGLAEALGVDPSELVEQE
jgi:transcriptional regulator with XRE-family HTH domain